MSYRKDYLSKTLAGALLGLGLAMALAACVAWMTPGGPAATNKFQFAMWIVPPVWVAALGLVYLFRDGRRAWRALGLANVAAFGAYLLFRLAAG